MLVEVCFRQSEGLQITLTNYSPAQGGEVYYAGKNVPKRLQFQKLGS